MYDRVRFLLAGDMAVVVEAGNAISPEINRKVRNLTLALQREGVAGVTEIVPTYRSLLVYYDPLRLPLEALQERIRDLENRLDETALPSPRLAEIPTVYGGEFGPDLDHVAEHGGLTTSEVVEIHAATDYLIYMMGFTPGFLYLGGMSPRIATPRLQTPRTLIPAGSVGIAQEQTGIYPVESPGGWQLIGRTPVRIFNPQENPPVIVEAGDYIRFVPIPENGYRAVEEAILAGRYRVTIREKA
jgi:inhibitor of KinA